MSQAYFKARVLLAKAAIPETSQPRVTLRLSHKEPDTGPKKLTLHVHPKPPTSNGVSVDHDALKRQSDLVQAAMNGSSSKEQATDAQTTNNTAMADPGPATTTPPQSSSETEEKGKGSALINPEPTGEGEQAAPPANEVGSDLIPVDPGPITGTGSAPAGSAGPANVSRTITTFGSMQAHARRPRPPRQLRRPRRRRTCTGTTGGRRVTVSLHPTPRSSLGGRH